MGMVNSSPTMPDGVHYICMSVLKYVMGWRRSVEKNIYQRWCRSSLTQAYFISGASQRVVFVIQWNGLMAIYDILCIAEMVRVRYQSDFDVKMTHHTLPPRTGNGVCLGKILKNVSSVIRIFDCTLYLQRWIYGTFRETYNWVCIALLYCRNIMILLANNQETFALGYYAFYINFLSNYDDSAWKYSVHLQHAHGRYIAGHCLRDYALCTSYLSHVIPTSTQQSLSPTFKGL